ncbi:hypothetical protein [Paracoccus sp. (in: a-proteobacteria)]|uniref:hypothetical protein n=1 Tax=Paracoccus sp. TaxID=267 RepID=UPI003A887840
MKVDITPKSDNGSRVAKDFGSAVSDRTEDGSARLRKELVRQKYFATAIQKVANALVRNS